MREKAEEKQRRDRERRETERKKVTRRVSESESTRDGSKCIFIYTADAVTLLVACMNRLLDE